MGHIAHLTYYCLQHKHSRLRGVHSVYSNQDATDAHGDDPLAQFAASGEAYVDFALGYPTYYRVMFSGDLLNSTGHESLRHTSTAAFGQMIEDLETCQELGAH